MINATLLRASLLYKVAAHGACGAGHRQAEFSFEIRRGVMRPSITAKSSVSAMSFHSAHLVLSRLFEP